jgi:hypothetical protein
MRVSIVLPAYNEANRLQNTVEKVVEAAKKTGYDFEIIVAEDGSTDGTDEIAAELARNYENIIHLHSDERLGRGRALINAFSKANGEIVVYMDVDLSTDLKHLKELIDTIAVDGYDVVTGSRLMKESVADRPFKRDFASRGYNFLVRLFLGSELRDHQCGFKAFKRDVILEICKKVKDNHWFWDTEVLVLAQKMGYRVKEIPVTWTHGGDTKVKLGKDTVYMFSQIVRLWLEEKRSSRKYLIATTLLAVIMLFFLAYIAGFQKVYDSLLKLKPEYLLLSTALYCSSYLLRGYRFEYMLSKLDQKSSLSFSTQAVSISQMVNVITPIRIGDLARAYVFKRSGVPYTSSLGAITAERVFDLISVALIATISALMLGIRSSTPFYAFLLTAVIIIAVIFLSRMENVVGKIFSDAKRFLKFREFVIVTLLSLLLWFSDVAVCYIIAMSYQSASPAIISLAVAVGNIVKALPVTPGGIGTYEAAVTAILYNAYPAGTAFTIALIDHAVKNFSTLLLGIASLASLHITLKEVRA